MSSIDTNKPQSINDINPDLLAYYRSINYSDEQILKEITNQIIYPTMEKGDNINSNPESNPDSNSNIYSGDTTPRESAQPFPKELLHPYYSGDTTPKPSAKTFPVTHSSSEPTVTCLIIAHGNEEKYKISSHTNKNIRILSRAGVPGCLGTCGPGDYDDIFHEYEHNIDSNLPSYQKLEKIQEKFLSEQQCAILYDTTNRENYGKASSKFSLDIFSKKGHSRIFKPLYDHTYTFTWPPEFKQGIHILEVNNPPANSDLKYKDNLINKRFILDEFNNPQQIRKNIEKTLRRVFKYIKFPSDITFKTDYESIEDVMTNFNPTNEDETKIKELFFEKWVNIIKKTWKEEAKKFLTPKNISDMLVTYQNIVKKNKLNKIISNFIAYFEENNYNCEHIFEIIYEIENTYKTQFFSRANIATAAVQHAGATSTITLMEIAA